MAPALRPLPLLALLVLPAAAGAQAVPSELSFPVTLRAGLTVDLGVTIIPQTRGPAGGMTVLAVPGLGQTANAGRRLAAEVLAAPYGRMLSRVVLLDLPGHGLSGQPVSKEGLKLGDLTLSDYAAAVVEGMAQLEASGLGPEVILAQGMGAVVVQLAQQALVGRGTSLKGRFGVRGAIFVAPDLPRPLAWNFADSGAGSAQLSPFIQISPALGLHLDFPSQPELWQADLFTNYQGELAGAAPEPAAARAAGLPATESMAAAAELYGGGSRPRPSVAAGGFAAASGTPASVIALEHDVYAVFPVEDRALYEHLTGDRTGALFFTVPGRSAVRGMAMSQPAALAPSVGRALCGLVGRPGIASARATRTTLWPPNRRMVNVGLSYATTGCGRLTTSIRVSSNEPQEGLEAGDAGPDWKVMNGRRVLLRAERSPTGTGRLYTIAITTSDEDGHSATEFVTVNVPNRHASAGRRAGGRRGR